MNKLFKFLSWVVTLLTPFILVLLGVRLVLNPVYPSIAYRLPAFPDDPYGFTTQERLKWSGYALKYLLNDSKIAYLADLKFDDQSPLFNQRELGIDFDSFANGLRAALRQAPKVILVGEMRDKETVEIGLSAAETGHLLLTTLHTVDAGQTVNRIVGMFEQEDEKQIRIRLADSIRWIACQRLLPKIGGGRVAAFEIMSTNLRVKDAILHGEGEGKTFYDIIEAGQPFGMMTFDQSITELYQKGHITEETALSYASRKAIVGRTIDAVKSARGEKTTSIEDLSIDQDYTKKYGKL